MNVLSVIMTSYNCAQYIHDAITSILSQSFKEFEFIIVDDGSTDGTVELIKTFKDTRIRLFPCEHQGRAAALNYALAQAQGDLIAFMDADDISLPERLEKQFQLLRQDPDIGIVSSWYQLIDQNGVQSRVMRKLPERHTQIEYEMTIHCSSCFPAVMVRREVAQIVGGFCTGYQSGVDFDFFLRLLPVCKFYNIQKSLLLHRIHSSSISARRRQEHRMNTLNLSTRYLNACLEQTHSFDEKRKLYFRLGLSEYYHGSMHLAREHFLKTFRMYWNR